MAKIVMIVGDFNEDLEVRFPQQALEMLGHEVHTTSPGKTGGSSVVTAVHDLADTSLQSYTEARGHDFPVTHDFSAIVPGSYDALVVPGGRAPSVPVRVWSSGRVVLPGRVGVFSLVCRCA